MMNKKLKEQLELVIMQCSALKASLDESLVRNKQYEAEIARLREKLEEDKNEAYSEEVVVEAPAEQAEVAVEEADEQIPQQVIEEPVAQQTEEETTEAKELPAVETAPEMQNFQSTLEMGADMVSQAVASSKEYIARLEASHPEGCSSLADIIRSRTDLFKVEISGIIGGAGSLTEKREKMSSALIKLIQYFENVK